MSTVSHIARRSIVPIYTAKPSVSGFTDVLKDVWTSATLTKQLYRRNRFLRPRPESYALDRLDGMGRWLDEVWS